MVALTVFKGDGRDLLRPVPSRVVALSAPAAFRALRARTRIARAVDGVLPYLRKLPIALPAVSFGLRLVERGYPFSFSTSTDRRDFMVEKGRFVARLGVATVMAVLATTGAVSTVTAQAAAPAMCKGHVATLVGTSGGDQIVGTPARDVIQARGGADEIRARGGNDLVCAGGGNDDIRGGRGGDHVYAGLGADELRGSAGRDRLHGGRGNDELFGGHGRDGLYGDAGIDHGDGGPGTDLCRSVEVSSSC